MVDRAEDNKVPTRNAPNSDREQRRPREPDGLRNSASFLRQASSFFNLVRLFPLRLTKPAAHRQTNIARLSNLRGRSVENDSGGPEVTKLQLNHRQASRYIRDFTAADFREVNKDRIRILIEIKFY